MTAKFAFERKTTITEEGSEPESFWKALGGKGRYCNDENLKNGELKARFFHCTDKTGTFVVVELREFSQDNLESKCIVILDVGYHIFVWISSDASDRATRRGENYVHYTLTFLVKSLVREYVTTLDDGRSNVPISLIEEGSETMEFTVYFHGWHYNETAKVTTL